METRSAEHQEAAGRTMALDFGAARTGVALADPTGTIVTPHEPVLRANSSDGIASIAALVAEHGVTCIVVGLPIGLRGDETKQTARCRSFAARLAQELGDVVDVKLHDERFTSKLADQTVVQTGSRAARDSLAASHLLTSWMETEARRREVDQT